MIQADKLFSLKRPCKDCPFRKGETMNLSLGQERMEEIIDSLHEDNIFSCHKTIDYGKYDSMEEKEHTLQPENKFCAGAMLYLLKENKPNSQMQIAERIGFFDPSRLEGEETIIDVIPMKMPWERAREAKKKEYSIK